MAGLNWATSEKPEEVIAFNFKVLDVDNNGYLDEQEIQYAVELVFKVRTFMISSHSRPQNVQNI